MHSYFAALSLTAIIVMAPGPDFAVVLRNSLAGGRIAGVMTAVGIGLAAAVHVSYTIAGIGFLLTWSPNLYEVLKLIGAGYLAFLSIRMFQSARADIPKSSFATGMPPLQAFKWGFFTNLTNPKVIIFILTVFLQIISPNMGLSEKLILGFIISSSFLIWFFVVSYLFTVPAILGFFIRIRPQMERVFGLLLILYAAGIASTLNWPPHLV
ncbi:LysE family translocator [Roseibium sp. RKSG952]|uniref:LysE family translocator n=1 Tax=Roseibium sp. RKSG952 TaxID=2529384 RepID=UPI0012BD1454|nr:LysE family translocator [Roseibium sp. RKSG952]MTH98039.1 LysE family translocator [Roseibium sp. RKSG952]